MNNGDLLGEKDLKNSDYLNDCSINFNIEGDTIMVSFYDFAKFYKIETKI